jgi:hypothetical protein
MARGPPAPSSIVMPSGAPSSGSGSTPTATASAPGSRIRSSSTSSRARRPSSSPSAPPRSRPGRSSRSSSRSSTPPAIAPPGRPRRSRPAVTPISPSRSSRSPPLRTRPASGTGARESLAPADAPHRAALRAPAEAGTLRLRVRGHGPLERFQVDPPPIVVRSAPTRLYWARSPRPHPLFGRLGDPRRLLPLCARRGRLDAIALTDHDHWGIDPLDERPRPTGRDPRPRPDPIMSRAASSRSPATSGRAGCTAIATSSPSKTPSRSTPRSIRRRIAPTSSGQRSGAGPR